MMTWLSVQQYGAAQPFGPHVMAALLATEGVYLFAAMAEHGEILPVEEKAASRTARKLTGNMRSTEAERASVFLGHALLVFAAGNFAETGNLPMAEPARAGLTLLREHYPLAAGETQWLTDAEATFRENAANSGPPSSGVTVTNFTVRASAVAIGLAIGERPPTAEHGVFGLSGLDAPKRTMTLTGMWFESAHRDITMLRDWLGRRDQPGPADESVNLSL